MSATIVVPCFNEAKRLDADKFLRFTQKHDDIRFLFVDDGSTDNTRQILSKLQQQVPSQIDLIQLAENQGKAEAVRQGILSAIKNGAKYVGYWDADLATPLEEIEDFLGVLNREPQIYLVMGSRVRLLGRNIQRNAARQSLGWMFASAASWALGLSVHDTQCGAKLFRVCPEIENVFSDRFSSRWIFDVELLARLRSHCLHGRLPSAGESIYESPVRNWQDVQGSKLGPLDCARAVQELVGIFFRYRIRLAHGHLVESPEPTILPVPTLNLLVDDRRGAA